VVETCPCRLGQEQFLSLLKKAAVGYLGLELCVEMPWHATTALPGAAYDEETRLQGFPYRDDYPCQQIPVRSSLLVYNLLVLFK
jgi:hypothetical protein